MKGVSVMSQRGQLIRLRSASKDEEPLWAYRYRRGGRGTKRVQRGGFVSRASPCMDPPAGSEESRMALDRVCIVWNKVQCSQTSSSLGGPW
jgi:hypothetical protein